MGEWFLQMEVLFVGFGKHFRNNKMLLFRYLLDLEIETEYNKRCVRIDLFAEQIENNGSSKEKLGKYNLSY